MESTLVKNLGLVLFFALVMVRLRGEESNGMFQGQRNDTSLTKNVEKSNKTYNEVVPDDKRGNNGGGGGRFAWGWGGGGGGGGGGEGGKAGSRRGWGWGWGSGGGGGGGFSWQWGCKEQPGQRGHPLPKKRDFQDDYKIGEFARCMVRGRCMGMRLDCPLHCGGPCFYDCRNMCKAHCNQ